MSRRHDLEQRRQSLAEIREIMNSMKSLAFMETRKLARFMDAQQAVVGHIREVAADFLGFHPGLLPEAANATPVYLLVGSERGFCGDYNRAVLGHMESALQTHPAGVPRLVVIGRRLCMLLEGDARVSARLDGASVVEEITPLLSRVVDEFVRLRGEHGLLSVYAIHHGAGGEPLERQLLPPFQELRQAAPRFAHPPLLNQSPQDFLLGLTDQYLLAALHELLYSSLMAENHRRVTHLERAVGRLDNQSQELMRQCNALRQEEIIEEIEVILLNAAAPGG